MTAFLKNVNFTFFSLPILEIADYTVKSVASIIYDIIVSYNFTAIYNIYDEMTHTRVSYSFLLNCEKKSTVSIQLYKLCNGSNK